LPAPEHTLIGSVLSSNGGAVVGRAPRIVPIDAKSTVTCPDTVSCEIEAQENIQAATSTGRLHSAGSDSCVRGMVCKASTDPGAVNVS
jgi:hypothetical protein